MALWLELTIEPSFGGKLEYSLLTGGDKPEYVITKKGSLENRYSEACRKWTVTRQEVDDFLAEMKSAPIFAIPDFVCGLDGRTTTLRISNGSHHVEYRWWCDLPSQWQNLQKVLDFLRVERGDEDPSE